MDTFSDIISFQGFDLESVAMTVLMVLLLCVSALVSGSETAFFSLTPTDVQHLRSNPSRSNNSILRLLDGQDELLAAILILNNLVNICIVMLSNAVMDDVLRFGGAPIWEFLFKVVIVTFLLLLFGEIMPKIFAAYNSRRFAQFAVSFIAPAKALLKPFSYILVRSGDRVSGSLSHKKSNISMEELSDAIEITGAENEDEKQMLSGIVGLVNKDVQAIMKPRLDIVALDAEAGFDQVKRVIIDSGFSRIPVYEGNLDNIRGVLYVKDMLRHVGEGDDFDWRSKLRKAYFIPENKKINDLLEEFQQSKVHLAVVVDEYGSTQGLVSLEDILEEIVGEITDESDAEEASYFQKIDDNNYIFDGKTHLSDFGEVMGMDQGRLDELRGDAETLAGLMLEIKGDFLRKGENLFVDKLKLTVDAMDGRRIDKIHVKRL